MRGYAKILPIVFALLLVSCAKQDTGAGPHATVVMRDGTQYAGNITSTSSSEVTLKGDDNAMHTLAMKDVTEGGRKELARLVLERAVE